jgi:hypothetical protein
MAWRNLGAFEPTQERPVVGFAAIRQSAMMTGNSIAEKLS